MAKPLICYVTYRTPPPSVERIAGALAQRRHALPDDTTIDPDAATPVRTPNAEIVFLGIDAPMPVGDLSKDSSQVAVWPDCGAESRAWRSHVIVMALGVPEDLPARRRATADLLRVVAALAEGTGASAVEWSGALVFHPTHAFVASVAANPLPPDVLVRGGWYGEGWSRAGIRTEGLAHFDLPEIDHPPTGEPAHEVAIRVLNIAAYLIAEGMVLGDGDTLGPTREAVMRVRHARTPEGALLLRLEPVRG